MEIALREFTSLRINPLDYAHPGVIAEAIVYFHSDDIPLIHGLIRFYIISKSLEALTIFLQDTIHLDEPLHAGRTLLHCAAQDGEADVVEWLLARGAQRDVLDSEGKTPANLADNALGKASSPALQERYQRIITLLTATPAPQGRQAATRVNQANALGMAHMHP